MAAAPAPASASAPFLLLLLTLTLTLPRPCLPRLISPSLSSPAVKYHMGPVLTSNIRVYLIWYGLWQPSQQSVIRDFFRSVSAPGVPSPSVSTSWWSTARLYTDQTLDPISDSVSIAGEHTDLYSRNRTLTRISTQEVIKTALQLHNGTLPVDPKGGVYILLTSTDVTQQDFCKGACGFHYFTYPSITGYTLPYAWIGNSAAQCPATCAYPFAVPSYMAGAMKPVQAPNGDIGIDGMITVIGHELAEMASNPLINAWFAGFDPEAPTEIADLCEGIYGKGAGGGYPGFLLTDDQGASYNVHGVGGRKFLMQWLWDPVLKACNGPNA